MPMAYNPPPSPWRVAGQGLLGIGDHIRDRNERKKRDERIAMLDERQAKLDEAEAVDRAVNRARLGVVEVAPGSTEHRAIGRDAIRGQTGTELPSLDPGSLARSTIPAHLGGLAAASLRGEAMPGLGGPDASAPAPKPFSAGDYLRGVKPLARESNLQRIAGTPNLYLDPSRTPEGRERAAREAERAAELARVEQERTKVREAAFQSAKAKGASDEDAAAFANAAALGFQPYADPRAEKKFATDEAIRQYNATIGRNGGLTPAQARTSAEQEAAGVARTLTHDPRFKNHRDPLAFVRSNIRVQFRDKLPEGIIQSIALDAVEAAKGGAAGDPSKATETERRVASLVPEGVRAFEIMEEFDNPTVLNEISRRSGTFGNFFDTPEGRRLRNAGIAFVNAQQFAKSGASASPGEAERMMEQYVPMPGDDEQTRAQKREMRRLALEAIKVGAGRAFGTIPDSLRVPEVSGGQPVTDDLLSRYGLTPKR